MGGLIDVPCGKDKDGGEAAVDGNALQVSKHGVASSSLAVGGVDG